MPPGPAAQDHSKVTGWGGCRCRRTTRTSTDAPAPAPRATDKPQESEGAAAPPGGRCPRHLPCPKASGSPTDPRSGRTPPAPPTLRAQVGGRQPACPEPPLASLLPTQNVCSEDSGQQRGHRGADQRLDRHTELRPAGRQLRHRPNTQGRALGGARPEPRPPLRPKGLRGRKAGPGRAGSRGRDCGGEDGAGGWWRVTPQASRRRPAAPGDGCSHLRNSVWPAWW